VIGPENKEIFKGHNLHAYFSLTQIICNAQLRLDLDLNAQIYLAPVSDQNLTEIGSHCLGFFRLRITAVSPVAYVH
jgi:hypothetical protein